jgi:hypothetical protein
MLKEREEKNINNKVMFGNLYGLILRWMEER